MNTNSPDERNPMPRTLELETATPAEIDAAWLEALAPYYRLHDRWNSKLATAAKYRRAGGHYAKQAESYDAEAAALYEQMVEARQVEAPFTAEWDRRGGWTRAYLVPDGHIHKTTACQSLYPTTRISWLPEQSGLSEDEIVELAGMMACTFCYPSAPVDALRAAAAAEKAKDECPGSRTWDHDSSGLRYASPRARCNHCHQTVSCTSTGKLRAHKPKATT